MLGSVLPDIDLKESRPSRALFAGLAVFLSFCVLFAVANRYSIAEMWIAWLGTPASTTRTIGRISPSSHRLCAATEMPPGQRPPTSTIWVTQAPHATGSSTPSQKIGFAKKKSGR